MNVQSGFLVIADISGYTAFLSHSELEPAAEHLRALLDLLVEQNRPPLIVSRLEGDAVISYALQGTFLQGETLVVIIEDAYIAFRQALERFLLNNRCDCNACHHIPELDLKFFVHYGSFLPQRLTSYTELVGRDVNLVHRLTKNTITDKTGFKAYVAYTEAAIKALGIEELADYMIHHEERYEHIGPVALYVQDVHALWHERQKHESNAVAPQEALVQVEQDFPLSPVLMWDFLTKPEYKAILAGSRQASIVNRPAGRVGAGASYQCLSGEGVTTQNIVAWEPFEQYSYESARAWGIRGHTTIRLMPIENGTRVTLLVSKGMSGVSQLSSLHDQFLRLIEPRLLRRRLARLRAEIVKEMAQGKFTAAAPSPVPWLAPR